MPKGSALAFSSWKRSSAGEHGFCLQCTLNLTQHPQFVADDNESQDETPPRGRTRRSANDKRPHNRYKHEYCKEVNYSKDAEMLTVQLGVSECH